MNEANDQIASQYRITNRELKIIGSQFAELDFGLSNRHNAVFGSNNLLHVLSKVGLANLSFEGAVAALCREAAVAGSVDDTHDTMRIPTADFVLSALRHVDPGDAAAWLEAMIRYSVRRARRCGMLQGVDTYAIDITDIAYYGNGLEG